MDVKDPGDVAGFVWIDHQEAGHLTPVATVHDRNRFLRECTGWAGCINASHEAMNAALGSDDVQGLIVTPGSIREGVIERSRKIVPRTGFIKMAMEHNAWLVPVYDASAADMYDIYLPLGTCFHSHLRYPWPVMARGSSFLPYLNPMIKEGVTCHLYIGHPIPTQGKQLGELVDEFYRKIDELRQMARDAGHEKDIKN